MYIGVLFDGAGLARLGLEQAGHSCVGIEIDPDIHYLSERLGSGNSVLADATTLSLDSFDALWCSPPCQWRSSARTQGWPVSANSRGDLLKWSLSLSKDVLWVENVLSYTQSNDWGTVYNAAQFLPEPLQNRNRIIGGRYLPPEVLHPYRKYFKGVCPCITATEYKGCATDNRRASRYYGRKLNIWEAAYHQGLTIPDTWLQIPEHHTEASWKRVIYTAIGNGVPVYMAKAFGEMY